MCWSRITCNFAYSQPSVTIFSKPGKGCVLLAGFEKPRQLQVDLALSGGNMAGSGGVTSK
jgi:hypothetical protein